VAHAICTYLKPKIKEYVEFRRESLRWFSRQTGVDNTTIYRLIDGSQKNLSFLNASRILKLLEPSNYLLALGEFYPDETREAVGKDIEAADKKTVVLEEVLKEYALYRVYLFAATTPDISREKVAEKFGADGLELLESLVEMGAISDVGGYLKDNTDGAVLVSIDAIKRNGHHNIRVLNLSREGTQMHNLRTNLNDVGIQRWYRVMGEAKAQLQEISENDDLKGDVVVVATMASGPIQ